MTHTFRIEVLSAVHDRAAFSSGTLALDRYFAEQVTQDARRRATACYVAAESATGMIAGFFTLAAAGVALTDLPQRC